MQIRNIQLYNYRNYKELQLKLTPNINIFIGDNAQGKTNIVEAVHYAALGISHRTRIDKDLINWEGKDCKITVSFSRRGVEHRLEFTLGKNTRKEILLNSEPIKQKDLPGLLTMILFSPEDLMLIKGAPQLRRRFIDIQLSQCSSVYYIELVKYNKILQQRNNLLKTIQKERRGNDLLEMWDEQLAKVGGFILANRLRGIDKLNEIANATHKWISQDKEKLVITYEVHGKDETFPEENSSEALATWLQGRLLKNREKDIFRGSTSVGIHRDDLGLEINEVDLKAFGSQGQQRSSVLSLKLAELEFLYQENGEYPILLLDDVMSELDGNRRRNLLGWLGEKQIQTLITATDKELFTASPMEHFYQVSNGVVEG